MEAREHGWIAAAWAHASLEVAWAGSATVLAAFLLLLGPTSVEAQGSDRLRVFLDCPSFCEQTHVRNEIDWIDWVRDREDSDVHLLISSQTTGSGGRRYTLAYIGGRDFVGLDDEIEMATSGDATQDETREEIVSTISLGLGRYLARTGARGGLRIQRRAGPGGPPGPGGPGGLPGTGRSAEAPEDPWDFWVFNVGLNGNANGESSNRSSSYSGSLSANRTTEAWKIEARGRFSRRESSFDLSDTTVTSVVETWSANGLVVKSLGPHFSAGLQTSAGKSTFNNQDFSWSIAPGVEYNFFPYSESTRRQFTVQYLVGLNHWDYEERTIYDVEDETRPNHSLAANLSLVQPWGQTSFSLSGVQYLHDTSFYRVDLFGSLNIRLFKGFSLRVSGNYGWVADQLYIPAGDLSDEDILLRQRAQETDRSYFTSFGISYRFGSIFNNVVNPRFGGGGGGIIFF
jgi:hypothetical protein